MGFRATEDRRIGKKRLFVISCLLVFALSLTACGLKGELTRPSEVKKEKHDAKQSVGHREKMS